MKTDAIYFNGSYRDGKYLSSDQEESIRDYLKDDRLSDINAALDRFTEAIAVLQGVHRGFTERTGQDLDIVHYLAKQIETAHALAETASYRIKEVAEMLESALDNKANTQFSDALTKVTFLIQGIGSCKNQVLRVCTSPDKFLEIASCFDDICGIDGLQNLLVNS